MKRWKKGLCLLLAMVMLLSLLAGCSNEPAASTEQPESSAPAQPQNPEANPQASEAEPTEPEIDHEALVAALHVDEAYKPELVRASEAGLPLDKAEQETITGGEMMELLDVFVSIAAPDKLADWQTEYPLLRAGRRPLIRFDAMAALFLAAQAVGGEYAGVTNDYRWAASQLTHSWDEDYLNWNLYGGFDAVSAFDLGFGEINPLDGASYNYNLGRFSAFSGENPFAVDAESNSLRVKDQATYAEALLAVIRLIDSTDTAFTGGGRTFEKTEVQSQPARYVPIDEVGTYNTDIITEDLLNGCTLADVDKADLPYWTGYILENKIWANQVYTEKWEDYNAGGQYFCEDEIRFLAENGFNCARVLYGFTFLSNPDDIYSINVSELEQLDELIAWGLKYNIHILLSITGLPGMWGADTVAENVGTNNAVFVDPAMEDAFARYWAMLSQRYAQIPNGVLSFEPIVESAVEDWEKGGEYNLQRYFDVLAPIARNMWQDRADRIVIANDLGKMLPAQLAEIGCCLSLHAHIYTTDERWMEDGFGIETEATWPMQYMPFMVDSRSGEGTLVSDTGFEDGVFRIYTQWCSATPVIQCDDVAVEVTEIAYVENGYQDYVTWEQKRARGEIQYQDHVTWEVAVPAGTREISFAFSEGAGLLQVELEQSGGTIYLPTHGLHHDLEDGYEPLPTIRVEADGTLTNLSGQAVDAAYIYNTYIKHFVDCAEENGVSFILTETGNNSLDLTAEENLAYMTAGLELLQEKGISWMYDCVHNIFGPRSLIWLNGAPGTVDFKNFSQWEDTCYTVNDDVVNALKAYQ